MLLRFLSFLGLPVRALLSAMAPVSLIAAPTFLFVSMASLSRVIGSVSSVMLIAFGRLVRDSLAVLLRFFSSVRFVLGLSSCSRYRVISSAGSSSVSSRHLLGLASWVFFVLIEIAVLSFASGLLLLGSSSLPVIALGIRDMASGIGYALASALDTIILSSSWSCVSSAFGVTVRFSGVLLAFVMVVASSVFWYTLSVFFAMGARTGSAVGMGVGLSPWSRTAIRSLYNNVSERRTIKALRSIFGQLVVKRSWPVAASFGNLPPMEGEYYADRFTVESLSWAWRNKAAHKARWGASDAFLGIGVALYDQFDADTVFGDLFSKSRMDYNGLYRPLELRHAVLDNRTVLWGLVPVDGASTMGSVSLAVSKMPAFHAGMKWTEVPCGDGSFHYAAFGVGSQITVADHRINKPSVLLAVVVSPVALNDDVLSAAAKVLLHKGFVTSLDAFDKVIAEFRHGL
jgi:hypothetical protein